MNNETQNPKAVNHPCAKLNDFNDDLLEFKDMGIINS